MEKMKMFLEGLHAYLQSVRSSNDGERNARFESLVLRFEVVVLVWITVGELVNLDVIIFNLLVDFLLHFLDLGAKKILIQKL